MPLPRALELLLRKMWNNHGNNGDPLEDKRVRRNGDGGGKVIGNSKSSSENGSVSARISDTESVGCADGAPNLSNKGAPFASFFRNIWNHDYEHIMHHIADQLEILYGVTNWVDDNIGKTILLLSFSGINVNEKIKIKSFSLSDLEDKFAATIAYDKSNQSARIGG